MPLRFAIPSLLAVFLVVVTGPSHTVAQDREATESTIKSPDAIVYVDGMACPFCAYGIEKKLGKLDGLQKMEIQLEEGRVLLAFKEGPSPTENEIRRAVKKAGFTARKIEFPDETAGETSSS